MILKKYKNKLYKNIVAKIIDKEQLGRWGSIAMRHQGVDHVETIIRLLYNFIDYFDGKRDIKVKGRLKIINLINKRIKERAYGDISTALYRLANLIEDDVFKYVFKLPTDIFDTWHTNIKKMDDPDLHRYNICRAKIPVGALHVSEKTVMAWDRVKAYVEKHKDEAQITMRPMDFYVIKENDNDKN